MLPTSNEPRTGYSYRFRLRQYVSTRFATIELKTEKDELCSLEKGNLSKNAFAPQKRAKKQRTVNRRFKKSDSILHLEDPSTRAGLGALWQEIAYVLSETRTCIARVGAGESDAKTTRNTPPRQIPFTILSGLLEDQEKSDDRIDYPGNCRYALGYIHVPRGCGDDCYYSLGASGTFSEDESVERAAAAYLKVISFGIAMRKSVMKRILGAYTKGRIVSFHVWGGRVPWCSQCNQVLSVCRDALQQQSLRRNINQGEI